MRLRVDWLGAPGISADELVHAYGDDIAWVLDPARDEWTLGFGTAFDATASAAHGLESLAETVARAEIDASADAASVVAYGGAVWLGAAPFDPARASGGVWGEAPAARWVVPEVAFLHRGAARSGRGLTLCAVAGARDRDDALRRRDAALGRLRRMASCASAPPESLQIASLESPGDFRARVEHAVRAIAAGHCQKLVLARADRVASATAFAPALIQERLAGSEPEAVRFSFPMAGGTMLGASPERLVRIEGGKLSAAAVAGSAARSEDPEEDRARARALVDSKKDQEEHAWVRDHVGDVLAPLAPDLEWPEAPGVLSTRTVHHLYSPFRGTWSPARDRERVGGVLAAAGALGPTPAVSGAPDDASRAWLRTHEPLARGAYAGPFGWAGQDGEGAIAVMLRSALVRGPEAFVFAGAGIVGDSDPSAELEETRLKMSTLRRALGAD